MDLVRLGLERGESAFSAVQVILELLEQYGQGGNCAEHFSFTYQNSFLIADYSEAWVLETAGKYWVTETSTQGTRSISSSLSIRSAGDIRHPDVIAAATAYRLCSEANFDFAKLFGEGGIVLLLQGRTGESALPDASRQLFARRSQIDSAGAPGEHLYARAV